MRLLHQALLIVSLITATFSLAHAQPGGFSYQGYLTDDNGVPLDTTIDMVFTLYGTSDGGWFVYDSFPHSQVTVNNGLFSVVIGGAMDFESFVDPVHLGIKVGDDPEMPKTALTAVPYAMQSRNSVYLDGRPAADYENYYLAGSGLILNGHVFSIQTNSVTSDMIEDGAVSTTDIENGTIRTDDIQDGTITGLKIGPNSIDTEHIWNGTIKGEDIQDNTIGSEKLKNEPGIKTNANPSNVGVGTSSFTDVVVVTINIPAPGYIHVTGNSTAYLSGSSASAYAILQIDEASGGTTKRGSSSSVGAASFATSSDKHWSMAVTCVYHKLNAGSYTFRLEGIREGAGAVAFDNSTITAIYYPTEY